MNNCIIDFHVHPIDLFWRDKLGPKRLAEKMLVEMDHANVCRALLYASEFNVKLFRKYINPPRINKAIEDAVSWGLYSLPRPLMRAMEDPHDFIREHEEILAIASINSEYVIDAAKQSKGRLLAVASPDISMKLDELVSRVEKLLREDVVAVKILPTIQMIEATRESMKKLDYIASLLEEKGRILIIHTGCDPGIWELPALCEVARPSRFEALIRRHRDLPIVLAHMGAYSVLKPGIYVHEAIHAMRVYSNVYGDTAAVEPDIVFHVIEKVGDEKVVFGSDYPVVVGFTWRNLVERIQRLSIPERSLEKILWGNAAKLLGLDY